MPSIVIRRPAPEEFPRVSAQIARSYKAAYRGLMLDAYLDALPDSHWVPILNGGLEHGDTCLIAEQGDALLGSVVFGPSEEAGNADWHAIYLVPEAIGKGVAPLLYARMEQEMRAQGFTSSTLEVLSQNRRAIAFYQRQGYAATGDFTVHENGMDLTCLTMRKALA